MLAEVPLDCHVNAHAAALYTHADVRQVAKGVQAVNILRIAGKGVLSLVLLVVGFGGVLNGRFATGLDGDRAGRSSMNGPYVFPLRGVGYSPTGAHTSFRGCLQSGLSFLPVHAYLIPLRDCGRRKLEGTA